MSDEDLPLRLAPASPSWPADLKNIEAPPEFLWVRGRSELLLEEPRVAIVGSRSPTSYGREQARRFARALADRGVVVVSGMARGIDEEAHRGALDAGGTTLAVLGSGVDRPWPRGELARRLAREGALLSEFPPDMPPRRHHFPLRNRLLSGLSRAVLVVEAAYASGSLITARWGADQGREVFALPGRVDHPMARGCHRLIRDGARLVQDPEEILEEIGYGVEAVVEQALPTNPLLAALHRDRLTADQLALRLRRSTPEVLVELVRHELGGIVARSPGGLWRVNAPP